MATGFVERLGARAAYVYRREADPLDSLVLAASRSQPPVAPGAAPPPLAEWPTLSVATRTRELQLSALPNPANSQFGKRNAAGGAVTVVLPLCCPDRVLGAVCAIFAGALSPADTRVLANVGDVLGSLLDAAVQRDRTQAAGEQRMAELEHNARARDDWTQTLAYELRLALINIVLLGGQLARGRQDLDVRSSLRHMLDNADRFNDLVRQLLDVSRVAGGNPVLSPRRGDLLAFVHRLIETRGWSSSVRVHSDADLPPLMFDAQRLGEVLATLITNARRLRPQGPIELDIQGGVSELQIAVRVATERRAVAHGEPMVEVFFSAAGLADDAANVGIDICKVLIEAHGGRLWVESNAQGRGVRFALPLSAP